MKKAKQAAAAKEEEANDAADKAAKHKAVASRRKAEATRLEAELTKATEQISRLEKELINHSERDGSLKESAASEMTRLGRLIAESNETVRQRDMTIAKLNRQIKALREGKPTVNEQTKMAMAEMQTTERQRHDRHDSALQVVGLSAAAHVVDSDGRVTAADSVDSGTMSNSRCLDHQPDFTTTTHQQPDFTTTPAAADVSLAADVNFKECGEAIAMSLDDVELVSNLDGDIDADVQAEEPLMGEGSLTYSAAAEESFCALSALSPSSRHSSPKPIDDKSSQQNSPPRIVEWVTSL